MLAERSSSLKVQSPKGFTCDDDLCTPLCLSDVSISYYDAYK
jgi:hypothetical protein